MTRTTIVALEHGVRRDGASVHLAEIRPVTGEDELALAELDAPGMEAPCMAARSTELLARTVARIGNYPGASRDEVRALSIGDRERLLLALYAISFGSTPQLSTICAHCHEQLEFPVSVAELILAPAGDATLEHTEGLGGAAVRFRLLTGDDQEAAANLAKTDPEAGARLLLERCLIEAPDVDRDTLRHLMAERLAALDPQAETILEADCPACGAPARLLIDAAPLVFASMAGTRRVMAEIDQIARTYHWSEREILLLPTARRRTYLDLIADGAPKL
jgi:hypothetical protein